MKIVKQENNKMVIKLDNGATVEIENTLVKINSNNMTKANVKGVFAHIRANGNIDNTSVHTNLEKVSKKKINYKAEKSIKGFSVTSIFEKGQKAYNSVCCIFSK